MRPEPRNIQIKDLERVANQFYPKVRVAQQHECWAWTASTNRGYGRLNVKGTMYYAHRLALHLKGIEIPDGMLALHTCNNPQCCNPDHLYVGTHKDNAGQMLREGRGRWQREPKIVRGESETTVQWRIESELVANAELHAIASKVSVQEIVNGYLETLPKYTLTVEQQGSAA